jgi:hypothetical protein
MARWIQHYMIKFVSDLRQIDGFLWVENIQLLFEMQIQYSYMEYYIIKWKTKNTILSEL